MIDPIVIRMDGEPRGKGRPRFSRLTGAAYTPERTARYEERLAWIAQAEMAGRPLLDGPIRLDVQIYMSIPKSKPKKWREAALSGDIRPTGKPDWDNVAKMTDALNKVVWHDDGQVVFATVCKYYSDRPRLEMTICPILDKLSVVA